MRILMPKRSRRQGLAPTIWGRLCRAVWAGRLVTALGVGGTGLALLLIASGQVQATTGGGQFPTPKVFVATEFQTPALGRFYVHEVGRKVRVISGQVDIADVQLGPIATFMVGEMKLEAYGSNGQPTTIYDDLYPWEFSNGKLSAGIVTPGSFTTEHREGIKVGELSLVDPRADYGVGNKGKEAKKLSGELTLSGRSAGKIGLIRGNDNEPAPNPLPKAKQIGRK